MARTDTSTGGLERTWRRHRAHTVAVLARRFGDLDLAEDATQEAFAAAHRRWPLDGEPDRPGAWLQTVAHRKAIGIIRKRRESVGSDGLANRPEEAPTRGSVDDALLGLLLACCHPALEPETRIALTLRHVCGLTADEIAAAFVVPEATMAKRLVRARAKIRHAGIGFHTPCDARIRERLGEIHTVIYVVFTEGAPPLR